MFELSRQHASTLSRFLASKYLIRTLGRVYKGHKYTFAGSQYYSRVSNR